MSLIAQEMSQEREIEIPAAVRDIYRMWRPTPLYRARNLEKALGTTARIFYKYEGVSPAGSHKPNTAVPQAFYNAAAGVKRLTTETGAGQWGSALAFACQIFGLSCDIWQVRSSYEGKPYRHVLMETFGATVTSSPSAPRRSRRAFREQVPISIAQIPCDALAILNLSKFSESNKMTHCRCRTDSPPQMRVRQLTGLPVILLSIFNLSGLQKLLHLPQTKPYSIG